MPDLIITGQTPGPCGCCGGAEACYLDVPVTYLPEANFVPEESPVVESTEAAAIAALETIIDNETAGCIAKRNQDESGRTTTGFTASASSGAVAITHSSLVTGGLPLESIPRILVKLRLQAGELSIPFEVVCTASGYIEVGAVLFDSDGNIVTDDNDDTGASPASSLSGTMVLEVPSAGDYYVFIGYWPSAEVSESADFEASFEQEGLTPCTVRGVGTGDGNPVEVICE